jgi:EpsD family peptidyl-prolyl cis-trans isomerase
VIRHRYSLFFLALLAGCGGGSHPPASQVVAKVNKDEITVHQLNGLIERANARAATPEQQAQVTTTALRSLVDEQLLVEQAIDQHLDRDPQVLSALEAARRQVLAQAYVARSIGNDVRPSDDDMHKYYDANAGLFAQRRVYALQEIAIPSVPADKSAELDARAQKAKTIQELSSWLTDNKIPFKPDSGVRGAEQLPLQAVAKFAAMKDGDIGVFRGDGRVTILQIVHSEAKPVDFDTAKPSITQFLANRKREELLRNEVARLRQAAKIEYVGDFAKYAQATPAATASPAAPAPGEAAPAAPVPVPAVTPAPPSATPAKPNDSSTEKGLKGL